MTETGFPAIWDNNYWDQVYVWEDVEPPPEPPDDTDYTDSAATHSIEITATCHCEVEVAWSLPPSQITPLRHFNAVMNDYRVLQGRPFAPPTLDCAVPVYASVDPKGVSMPSTTRAVPGDIDTGATLRWYVDDAYVEDDNDIVSQWWDTTGTVAWSSYDDWQPLCDDDFSYQIALPNSKEVIIRPTMIFNPTLGNNMSTQLSIDPINNVADVEFWLVMWSHPLLGGQEYSTVLDNGQPVQGFHDMPFYPGDSLAGMRQAFQRWSDKAVTYDGDLGLPLSTTQVSSSGRPVLYRVRFGVHPLIEAWGPTGSLQSYAAVPQPQQALDASYVLGRQWNYLSPDTNAGMHLFEINYFDHMLTDAEAGAIHLALDSCYAVSA